MTRDPSLHRGFRISETIESPTAIVVLFGRKAAQAERGKGRPRPAHPDPRVKVVLEKQRPRFYWLVLPWFTDPSRKQFEAEALRRFDDSREQRASAAPVRPRWSPE